MDLHMRSITYVKRPLSNAFSEPVPKGLHVPRGTGHLLDGHCEYVIELLSDIKAARRIERIAIQKCAMATMSCL